MGSGSHHGDAWKTFVPGPRLSQSNLREGRSTYLQLRGYQGGETGSALSRSLSLGLYGKVAFGLRAAARELRQARRASERVIHSFTPTPLHIYVSTPTPQLRRPDGNTGTRSRSSR